jgi:hypothetical protein
MNKPFLALLSAILIAASAGFAAEPPAGPIKFETHRIGSFRSEACCVGDFNNDGKLDIVAGPNLYLAPKWTPVEIRKIAGEVDDKGKGYYHDFANLPMDVDGDGLLDVVAAFWHEKSITWFRNPGKADGLWKETTIDSGMNFETADLCDLTGKSGQKPTHILPHVKPTVWYELLTCGDKKGTFAKHVLSEKPGNFGGGVGDINGDGRLDLVRPDAWFEAPADLNSGTWKEHPLALGSKEEGKSEHTAQIAIYDVNCDGLNDIIASSAHRYGIFWYEQVRAGGDIQWKRHLIDDTWTQAHSITLADMDGDGLLDLVTAKRFMAHNGSDPDEAGTLGVYWYRLQRKPSVSWTKYAVSYDKGIGSGINNIVVDLDADGDLDIVVTGKWGGPAWFENKTK